MTKEIKYLDDGRRFPGSNDTVFKNLFKNKEILCSYLKYFTDFDIKPEEVSEGNGETKYSIESKGVRMDLKFDIVNDLSVDIEFQNEVKDDDSFRRRLIHYLSLMYSSSFNTGSNYEENKMAVLVVFVNTEDTILKPLMHFKLTDKKNDTSWDDIQIYIINIPKFIKGFNESNKDDIIKLKLLDVLTTDDGSKYKNDELDLARKIEEAINIMNKEDALRFEMIKAAADRTEQRELGKKEGIKEGIKEGERANLERNIKTMASNGFDADFIAKALSLDPSLVKEVLEKQ